MTDALSRHLAAYRLARLEERRAQERADRAVAEIERLMNMVPEEIMAAGSVTLDALRAACVDRGLTLTGDGHVGRDDAAVLLGISVSSLRQSSGIPCRKMMGRAQYALQDLAEYLDGRERRDP